MRDNILAQSRSEIYAREYASHRGSPLNRWLDTPIRDRREGFQNTRDVVDRYLREDVYAAPERDEEDAPFPTATTRSGR